MLGAQQSLGAGAILGVAALDLLADAGLLAVGVGGGDAGPVLGRASLT